MILDKLNDMEAQEMDAVHANNKRVHLYRRVRRQLLDKLEEINQLAWDFE